MTDQFKKLKTVLNNSDLLTSISIKELKQLRLFLFGILLYRKMEILPWYLVFGAFGTMMMLRVLVPSTKEISGVPLYYWLRCRHLIFSCIPMSVLVVLVIKSENPFDYGLSRLDVRWIIDI